MNRVLEIAAPSKAGCEGCRGTEALGFDFTHAFQPIVDLGKRSVFAYEALVRGMNGEPASTVLDKVNHANRYRFDQACRVEAIRLAAALDIPQISINFLPNAVYRPEVCIRTTLDAAEKYAYPIDRIIFEATEGERVDDGKWLAKILREYKRMGFRTAIDDFGAGYAGLNLLADFQPDIVKLDMELIRGIDASTPRQAIVSSVVSLCAALDIQIIAEGVETTGERAFLHGLGIRLMQGYLFAKPGFRAMPEPVWSVG